MKHINDILLNKDASIREALTIIDTGAKRIALVVDSNQKLIGTLSDGDIRRGLLNNLSLDDSVESIIYKTPTVANIKDSQEKILELAVLKGLYQIPIIDDNGKLIGLKEVDELLHPTIKSNKIVLMVGGLGTRLRPLTEHIPKPMLKVGGKPILETIILNFKKYGFTNIILSVSYKAEIIEDYFRDGSELGVAIEYIHESKRMGTAGALSLIKEKLKEPFFVMNGDLLTSINFEHMLEYHTSHESYATMGVREYDFQVPYGVVHLDNENIISIEEKPVHKFFVSAGIYIFNAEVLSLLPTDEFYDMPTFFEDIIQKNLKSISFPIHEYWLDIGRIEEFERANNEYGKVF